MNGARVVELIENKYRCVDNEPKLPAPQIAESTVVLLSTSSGSIPDIVGDLLGIHS